MSGALAIFVGVGRNPPGFNWVVCLLITFLMLAFDKQRFSF